MSHYWFISPKQNHNSRLALFTFLLAFVVILLGAYTRLTNAGLSCPDWPNCYGYITAPHTNAQLKNALHYFPLSPVNVTKAWTEMTHRYFAGTEGLFILILSFTMLLNPRKDTIKNKFIPFVLISLLILQVLLGMLTVTEKLKPVIVLSHLLTGISILSMLWWAYLESKFRNFFPRKGISSLFMLGMWGALIIVITQITLGGWVSTHYAGLACIDFPYCNGKILPTLHLNQLNNDLITIHMLHRLGAIFTGLYIVFISLFLFRHPHFKSNAALLLSLIAVQITLGILNIIWLRPLWIALIHQGVAILLLLTIIAALVKATSIMEHHYGSWVR